MEEKKKQIVSLLQNYYTQVRAYSLAQYWDLDEFLRLQCKRYSLDYNRLSGRVESKPISISEVVRLAKYFED